MLPPSRPAVLVSRVFFVAWRTLEAAFRPLVYSFPSNPRRRASRCLPSLDVPPVLRSPAYITTDVRRGRISHFVSPRSIQSTKFTLRECHAHFYTFVCPFYTVGQPLTSVPSRYRESFQLYVTGPPVNPRFASRPLCLPLTILSRLSSPTPFCSFSPRRRSHCPPIVTSIRCLRTNSMRKRFYAAPEVKGGARVPESHPITHLSRCTHSEKTFVCF